MTTKFSQFPAGGTIGVGAKIAGLDASVSPDNRIFDFPGLGILDTNGSVLLGWSQPLSGTAVNYLEFQNALSGNPAVISAVGGDTDVGLYLTSQNNGNISLVPGGQGVTIISGTTALGLPNGTTGQRPIGVGGYTRYNSDTGTLEYYDALSAAWNTLSAGGSVASVSGTAGRITSTGGVNPVIDIDFGYVGQASIQNLGTIIAGTWEADIVQPAYGGTGLSSIAPYSVVCGGITGSGPLQVVSSLGAAGQVLTSNGAGMLPTWQSAGAGTVVSVSGTANRITSTGGSNPIIDISASYVGQASINTVGTIVSGMWNASPVSVLYGGTGDSSFTPYSVICGGVTGSGNLQNVVGVGILGEVLTSNGPGALPTWTSVAGGTVSSVSGTAGEIVVVNGSTTPVVSIDPTYVGQSSITTLGTVSTGTWNGSIVSPTYGGTGVNNGSNTLTLSGNLTSAGGFSAIFTMTGVTSVTFPTSGTLATTSGTVSTVSGTLNRITSTGGTTPIIDISASYVGQASITTLGTVTTGTWNGSTVDVSHGGTGDTSFAAYTVICAGTTATSQLQSVGTVGTSGQVLTSQGAGLLPIWATPASGSVTSVSGTAGRITSTGGTTPVIDIDATYVGQTSITTLGTVTTGTWNATTVAVSHGGTGVATIPAYSVMCGGTTGTGPIQTVGGLGTSGQVLTSAGAGALPVWTTPTTGTVTSVTGTANRITSTGGATPVIDIAATYVGQTSITTLGTIVTGTWNGTIVSPTYGGTGINNGSSTITIGGNHTLSGAFTSTFTLTGATTVTFPTSGTLAILGNNDFNFSTQYRQQIKDYSETVNPLGNVSGAVTIDLTLGNSVTATATGNITSITVTNVPASGQEASFSLRATNFGAFTVSWPSGTSWPQGVTPTLSASGLSIVVFSTVDNGTTWSAFYPGEPVGSVTSIVAGTGLSGGTITTSGTIALATNTKASGRLTLTSGVPVTTSDVLAATTIYFTPYNGYYIDLYTSGAWKTYTFSEISIAVPATTNQMYDMFVYDNSGTLTLSTVAWTNDTTRATALALQNGVYVLSGSPQYRYLGSFRTTAVSGQTEDSVARRFVWNYYNRAGRTMSVVASTTWTYAVNTIRQANASSTNQLNFVVGVSDEIINAQVSSVASAATNNRIGVVYVGLNSTTAPATGSSFGAQFLATSTQDYEVYASFSGYVNPGYNYLAWLESSPSAVAITYGTVTNLNQGAIIGNLMA